MFFRSYSLAIIGSFLFLIHSGLASEPRIIKFKNSNIALAGMASFGENLEFEELVPSIGLYLVKPKEGRVSIQSFQTLLNHESVELSHADYKVSLRESTPNDSRYAEKWGLKMIQAPKAWDFGVGGKDALGNEIVVAVIDDGFDIEHKDLKENIYKNLKETPGNGIDDDGNGYIDDVNGWNAYTNSGKLTASSHGTHVSGIIGAVGNNGNQVMGINWNVKVLTIQGSSGKFSNVAKAYNYVIIMRSLWNKTNGVDGAFIVSTNSSFGVDGADCTSDKYKAWDAIYAEMGSHGVLSAAATANRSYDIDVRGDVPTGCSADHLIAVTNTNSSDKRNSGAAWGPIHVDLGAPGTNILSTTPHDNVRLATGTSMATPVIAGAVGLLYSLAPAKFFTDHEGDPAGAALAIKKILLDTVDPLADLTGKTVSGGRINIFKAAEEIRAL